MIGSKVEPAIGLAPREWPRALRRTLLTWRTVTIATLAMPGLMGCGGDFHLSASTLDIGPNPAVSGEIVVASFFMNLIPTQNHTIVVIIDDAEHLRLESNDPPPIPVVIQLGNAADLIATYGLGDHEVYVQVHARDEAARTQSVVLQLTEAEAEP
jgi:hypothetical protein